MGAHRKISDEQIAATITDLFGRTGHSAWPSVVEVAGQLRRDHGHQGTHERIRAVLSRAKEAASGAQPQTTSAVNGGWQRRALELEAEFAQWREQAQAQIEALQAELKRMRERAELAETREDASTQRWMMEVDRARQELQAMDARRPKGVPHEQYLELYRELEAARREVASLRGEGSGIKTPDSALD